MVKELIIAGGGTHKVKTELEEDPAEYPELAAPTIAQVIVEEGMLAIVIAGTERLRLAPGNWKIIPGTVFAMIEHRIRMLENELKDARGVRSVVDDIGKKRLVQ